MPEVMLMPVLLCTGTALTQFVLLPCTADGDPRAAGGGQGGPHPHGEGRQQGLAGAAAAVCLLQADACAAA